MRNTVSLKKNSSFLQLYKEGKSTGSKHLVVFVRKNDLNQNRLGISVSKKMGKANKRNKQRRRIKEAYRLLEKNIKWGYDIVMLPRPPLVAAEFSQIVLELEKLMKRQGLIK